MRSNACCLLTRIIMIYSFHQSTLFLLYTFFCSDIASSAGLLDGDVHHLLDGVVVGCWVYFSPVGGLDAPSWIDASSCIRVSVQPNFFCAILPPLDHQHLWLRSHCPLNFLGQPIEGASVVCVSSELLSHTDMIHLRGVD